MIVSDGSKPTVLSIVLNYKTAEMTLKSAAAAYAAMEGISGGIIIVDNDSQDGSFETIQAHVAHKGWDADGRVRVLQSGHNGGFGAGNNEGIRAGLPSGSKPDYIYILNSDAFPAPDAIQILLDHLQSSPETGFAGSHLNGLDGHPHSSCFRFHTIVSEFESALRFGPVSRLLKSHTVSIEIPEQTTSVDWVAGASMMIRRTALDEVGLFDEAFFLYFEETDLCLRAARAGYKTDFVPASNVVHVGSVSTGMKTWERVPSYWYDSRWYYFAKNHGRLYAATATSIRLLGGGLHSLRCLLAGKDRNIAPNFYTSLFTHGVKNLVGRSAQSQQKETCDTVS